MLSCVLPQSQFTQGKAKVNIPQCNDDSAADEIQSITLNIKNVEKRCAKFPILHLINGWLSSNQNAAVKSEVSNSESSKSESRKLRKKKKNLETYEDQLSVVFIRSYEDKVYKLTFKTINCTVIPLYTVERPSEVRVTDKKIQPYSKSYFLEEYTPHLSRLNTRRKDFQLNHRKDGHVSIMSFKEKLGKARTIERKEVKTNVAISANKTNLKKSVVYLTVNKMSFKLNPKIMTLEFSKPLYHESLSNYGVRDIGLESNVIKKNKGSIIAKCDGDILKFNFQMEDINYQYMSEMITRSCQIKDTSVYIRCFSEISNKIVYVPLPRNIYNYKDPMVDIRRRNKSLKFHNIEPLWMSETRKERLKSHKLCQQVDPGQKAFEATNGSNLIYEGPGTLNKAKEGLIPCKILPLDRNRYERWIMMTQSEHLHQTLDDDVGFEKYDSIGSHEVPDWDLTIYMK